MSKFKAEQPVNSISNIQVEYISKIKIRDEVFTADF